MSEVSTAVPHFESVDALRAGLESKARFEPIDLYPRDGSSMLGEVEARVASLAGVTADTLLVYNSGMSAATEAIDIGLHVADTSEPVLLCSQETYTQTKKYLDYYVQGQRAKVVYFDSGDAEDVDRTIDKWQPDVVVTETVTNYVNVPVLDIGRLLNKVRNSVKQPTVVLDNTLPLSTGLAIGELIAEEDKVIVVESGTKSYTFNSALLGVGYTKNVGLHDWLLRYRRTRGSLPGPDHLEAITGLLPIDRESFDDRNQKLFKTTGGIAIQLAKALQGTTDFSINHPAVPAHDNHDLYKRDYPDGGAPVLYISSKKLDQYETAELLWANPNVRDQSALGQSFGFDHARIVADENIPAVRLAGGASINADLLGGACAEALLSQT